MDDLGGTKYRPPHRSRPDALDRCHRDRPARDRRLQLKYLGRF